MKGCGYCNAGFPYHTRNCDVLEKSDREYREKLEQQNIESQVDDALEARHHSHRDI